MPEHAAKQAAEKTSAPPELPLAKTLLEIGPLVVFFIANSQAGIFWGTAIFMVATAVALAVSRTMFGRLPIMPLVSGFFVLAFGGLTLILQDELFIKLKPTIVNLLFATALFGGLYFNYPIFKVLFGEVFSLRDQGWRILTFRWATFFLFLAALNEIVWRSFSTSFWISFKAWGIIPITMIFAVCQIGVLKRYEDAHSSGAADGVHPVEK